MIVWNNDLPLRIHSAKIPISSVEEPDMINLRIVTIIALALLITANCSCLRKSITDDIIEAAVITFMDAPVETYTETQARTVRPLEGAPSNLNYEDYLTTEERSVIESLEIYRNILKLQLVEGADQTIVEAVGTKITRAFAHACRDVGFLETQYLTEVRMYATVDDERDNFLIADISFANRNDRISVEEYSPSRSRN